MVDRAAIKVEVLPIEFFHQLTSGLNGNVELLAIRKDARIVAFSWNVHAQSSYYAMYGGLDYQLNREFDLYFNLIYAVLDRALSKQVSTIEVGLGADVFKARIGCYSEPLYVYVKGRGSIMSSMIRAAGNLLIARKPAAAPFNIFKNQRAAEKARFTKRVPTTGHC
jgi:hypothetical protein